MPTTNLVLRDVTAGADVSSEDIDTTETKAISARLQCLRASGEMNALSLGDPARAGHTMQVKKDGVVLNSYAPLPAWVSKTVVLHASGGAEVDSVVCATRDLYAATMVRFKLAIEGNPGLNYYITES